MDKVLIQTNKKAPNLFARSLKITAVLIFLMSSLAFVYFIPSFEKAELNQSGKIQIYYMGNLMDGQALYKDNQLYLPIRFIQEQIDPTLQWDQKEKIAIVTTNKNVFHFPLGKKEGLLNLDPYNFTYPLIEENGEIYLPIDPIQQYYDLQIVQLDHSIINIHDLKKPIQQAIVLETTKLRKEPTLRSPWISEIEQGEEINIIKEEQGWYWIETKNGLMGYVDKRFVQLTSIITNEIKKEIYQPWNPIGSPILLTWEYASNKTVNPDSIGNLSGLQVVSPTWFHLQKDGLVKNVADKKYVEWAHKKGYQVWGLFSNSFDAKLTNSMLNDPKLRIKVIKQLLSYVELYQLDGINVDFENVYLKDKEELVQFLRELTPLLHEKGRTVSIDVTVKSLSENWSMFYDRKKIGEIVDYVMLMAYDEHWATSPKAGSVASIPWVEKGIKGILEEVPNDKLILGVPFYTRLWKEEIDETGNKKVTSKTFTMEQTKEWIKKNNVEIQYDSESGQHYVEKKEGSITYKIWLEDHFSMQKRIELMKKYRLAGIAAWRRGFEEKEFWPVFSNFIKKPS